MFALTMYLGIIVALLLGSLTPKPAQASSAVSAVTLPFAGVCHHDGSDENVAVTGSILYKMVADLQPSAVVPVKAVYKMSSGLGIGQTSGDSYKLKGQASFRFTHTVVGLGTTSHQAVFSLVATEGPNPPPFPCEIDISVTATLTGPTSFALTGGATVQPTTGGGCVTPVMVCPSVP